MKKLLGTVLIALSTVLVGYGQQDNNTNDDVYYNDNYEQPVATPIDQQNNNVNYSDNSPTYQTFYDQLSPYGYWVNYPGYGYCWVPGQTDPDFSPYVSNGHWVYTDMGWTWVSDFAWGWGPFHYGRWFEDPYYGWMWMPGYDWAPAWVMWGDYGDYYGWACIGPDGYLSPHYRPDERHWHFVDHRYLGGPEFNDHIVRADVVGRGFNINNRINIISHANTYNQSVFFQGPKPGEVERYSGQRIERAQINNVSTPTQTRVVGNLVNIYRPNIVRNNVQQAAPAKISNPQDVRPVNRPQGDNMQRGQQDRQPQSRPQQAQPEQRNYLAPRQQIQNTTPPRQSVPQREYQYSPPSQPAQRSFVPSPRPSYSPSPSPSRGNFNSAPMQRSGGRR